jgi:molybdopterin molybdotransferase
MLTYEDAFQIVRQHIRPLPPVEMNLAEALGKVLAAPVHAGWDLPPADNSAMDGYAFSFSGQPAGAELAVTDFVPAGRVLDRFVPAGQAVKIMTGAPLPAGCDTVVPIEEVAVVPGGIRLNRPAKKGSHVRWRGEELREGELLVPAETPVHGGETALLASGGAARVSAYPAPRAAVIATGDELVELGTRPGPGQIVNSNCHFLASRLREEGATIASLQMAKDDPKELAACIDQGLAAADLLITSGGVSVGDRDLVQKILKEKGFQSGFWKVRIKPGKPLLFGMLEGKPVFGLPGNPGSTALTFELFVRPAIRLMAGFRNPFPPRLRARLEEAVRGDTQRQQFIWGTLEERAGSLRFHPAVRQVSGQNRSFQGAMALLPMPSETVELPAGTDISVIVLRLPSGFGPDRLSG